MDKLKACLNCKPSATGGIKHHPNCPLYPEPPTARSDGSLSVRAQPEAVTKVGDVPVWCNKFVAQVMEKGIYLGIDKSVEDMMHLAAGRALGEVQAAEADLAKAREVIAELVGAAKKASYTLQYCQHDALIPLAKEAKESTDAALQSAHAFMAKHGGRGNG